MDSEPHRVRVHICIECPVITVELHPSVGSYHLEGVLPIYLLVIKDADQEGVLEPTRLPDCQIMGVAGLINPRKSILLDVQRKHEGLVIMRVLVQRMDPYIKLPWETIGWDTVKETPHGIEHEPARQLKVDVT